MRQRALELEQGAGDLVLHRRAAALVVNRRGRGSVMVGAVDVRHRGCVGAGGALGAVGAAGTEDATAGGGSLGCGGDGAVVSGAAAGGERHGDE